MRRGTIVWVVLLLSAMIGLVSVWPNDANAKGIEKPRTIPGCTGPVQLMFSPMARQTSFAVPYPDPHQVETLHDIGLTTRLFYWHCPNGKGPTKIKAKYWEFCWYYFMEDSEEHWIFDGVRFNAWLTDSDGKSINPPWHWVKDNQMARNCDVVDVPNHKEIWQWMGDHPRYRVKSYVVRNNLIDEGEEQWDGNNGIWQMIRPKYDYPQGDWHY